MPTWTERRIDRSTAISEALDKLLSATAQRHDLVAAVVADAAGLLVATAKERSDGERLAGVVSLVDLLHESLSTYEVLDGLSHAFLRSPRGRGLAIWFFDVDREAMILALLVDGSPPGDDVANQLIEGVQRIFSAQN